MKMMHHREPFLNNIAERLKRERVTIVEKPNWETQPQHQLYEHLSSEDLLDMLEKQCAKIHTTFKRTTKEYLSDTLQNVFNELNVQSVVIPEDQRTDELGLTTFFSQLNENGCQIKTWGQSTAKQDIRFAEQADVGFAYSDITLAESGTVTILHGKHHGRTLTLLPKTFICLIEKETIVPRLTEAVQMIEARESLPSCISFISGPSNSADIELNLIVGVHGPVRAIYIVVD